MNRFAKIKDIAVLNKETFKKDSFPNIIKYLDTGSLTKNKIEGFQRLNTKSEKIPSRAQRKVFTNTILYSTVRPNQEHYGIIERNFKDVVVSTGFTTIDITDENTYPKYIYYLLTQKSITDYLHTIGMNAVSSYPSISPDDIGNLKFRLPDLPTQKSIAKVLSDLDAKIELNNRINRELEAMAKTLYDYWFVQFDFPNEQGKPYKSSGGKMLYNAVLKREIPEGWEVKLLGSEIEIQRGISYTSKEINGEGIPMINLNSFNLDGTYKPDGVKSYSGKYSEKNILKSGDLLIAATDVTRNADIIGRAILVPDYYSEDLVFSMDIAKIISSNIPSSFLMMLFNSSHYHNYIKWYATGTLVLHLNLDGVSRYKTEIPSNNLLKMFDKFYLPIADRIYMTTKQNQQLSELRDWLLPMLMNGQVTVKEAEERLSMAAEPSVEYKKG
jgi:type I restriction enzyme S subunit